MTDSTDKKSTLASQLESFREHMTFFEGKNKSNREKCVLACMLRCLCQSFKVAEIQALEPPEPDLLFREHKFEVVEKLKEGAKPHEDDKNHLKGLEEGEYRVRQHPLSRTLSWSKFFERIAKYVEEKKTQKYPLTKRKEWNLLVYNSENVNFSDELSRERQLPGPFKKDDWASICLIVHTARKDKLTKTLIIPFANQNAPDFIRKAVGKEYEFTGDCFALGEDSV